MIMMYLDIQTTATIDIVGFIVGITILGVIVSTLAIFLRLGGWPEGYYRIMRIPRFIYFIIDTDGNPVRHCIKASKIIVQSPPKFLDLNGKVRYIDRPNLTRSKGAPSHYYQPDNALPNTMLTGNRDLILDPRRIDRAYRTEIVTRLFKIGATKGRKISWGRIGLGLALVIGGLVALGILLHH